MTRLRNILFHLLLAMAGISFFLTLLGGLGLPLGVGGFLFDSFNIMGFYVPIYLSICAFTLCFPQGMRKSLLGLNLSLLPFLSLTLAFHVLTGNEEIFLSRYFLQGIGKGLSLTFLVLFSAVAIALIIKACNYLFPHLSWFPRDRGILRNLRFSPLSLSSSIIKPKKGSSSFRDKSPEALPFPSFPPVVDGPETPFSSGNSWEGEGKLPSPSVGLASPTSLDEVFQEDYPQKDLEEEPSQEEFLLEAPSVGFPQDPALNFLTEAPEEAGDRIYDDNSYEEDSIEDEMEELPPPGFPPKHKRQSYALPTTGLLQTYPMEKDHEGDDSSCQQARILEETLREFKIEAKVTGISQGPVITLFEVVPSSGIKVSKIVNLQDNLALRLAASSIRLVAPIPGKQAIGIEIPNKKRALVSYNELVNSSKFQTSDAEIPIILGKDISGGHQVMDLTKTPHLLIAGSTGSGKSVCVNSLICSILYRRRPEEVKMILVDPKIVELKLYNDIPHLLTPVITDSKKALQAIQWCLHEMERRYSLLDAMGVRGITSYNNRIKERDIATKALPYIILIIDEFADLMATSGKELEGIIARLAAMSRAVGIHLVLATQRPSIDVITGLIKANFPSRIAFMVASKTDSRIILDMMGAEKLLGRGDMLFTSAWDPFPSRIQGAFLSEEEVERIASYTKTLGEPDYIDDEIFLDEEDFEEEYLEGGGSSDPLYNKALDVVLAAGKASASYLQRRLQIGYNRAARLIEEMEIQGVVGPANGSKPREVVHIPDRKES